jgi:hypothetical protein
MLYGRRVSYLGRGGYHLGMLTEAFVSLSLSLAHHIYIGQPSGPYVNRGQLVGCVGGQKKQGVCYTAALPFILKSILWKKKNYGNSNI